MKILVFGIPCSGKTTFSNHLSEITKTPVFHIDRHFFEAGRGWEKRPQEDFLKDVRDRLEKDSWIIDGNGMRTLEMRYKKAHLVIFCSLPLLTCYFRIFSRALAGFFFGRKRPDCPEGAASVVTYRLLKYVWNFHSRYDSMINDLKSRYPKVEFIQAKLDKDLQSILRRFTYNL